MNINSRNKSIASQIALGALLETMAIAASGEGLPAEGVDLLNSIQDVYLCEDVTVA